jgi:ribosomal protein S18 acetylase RimI-like enzyme
VDEFQELRYKATLINLKNNEAYLWNMYTKESYRGRNLAPYLRYKSYEMLKEMGRDVIYSISDSFNTPAIKFKEKLNAEEVKHILYVKLFKCKARGFVLKSWKQ